MPQVILQFPWYIPFLYLILLLLSSKNHKFLSQGLFLWISASVAVAAALNYNGMTTLLDNAVSTIFINDKLIFILGPNCLPRNPSNCIISDRSLFHNFVLGLRRLETCLPVNNNFVQKIDFINILHNWW